MLDVPDDISYQPIFSYDTMLIAAEDHPLARRHRILLQDIGLRRSVLPPMHFSTWRMVDMVLAQAGVPYRVVLEAGGWGVIKKYVELSVGVSIVTSTCLTGREGLAVRSLGGFVPKRTYGVVLRRERFLSPAARSFVQTLDPGFFDHAAEHAETPLGGTPGDEN